MIQKMVALDWHSMKYYQLRYFILPAAAFLFGVIYSPIYVIPMMAFFGMSFSVNPFAVEEKGELNNLYLTLPITRKQIVMGRYALSFLIFLIGIVISIPIMLLSNIVAFSKYTIGVEDIIALIAISALMYAFCNLFTFPTLFKLGYQKGKIWGFYLPVIVFASIFGVYYAFTIINENQTLTIELIDYAANHLALVSGGFVLLAGALSFVSYIISVRIYSKRSF